MGYYSREVTLPHTRREGFCNFVQLIVNQLEAGNPEEALLQAVDLLDCISHDRNPYDSVTNAENARETSLLAEIKRKHSKELVDAMAKAREDGINAGISQERKRLALALGLS